MVFEKTRIRMLSTIIICSFFSFLFSNPFEIDFFKEGVLTESDYLLMKEKLDLIDVKDFLSHCYSETPWNTIEYSTFLNRISRGTKWRFMLNSQKPKIILEKIGRGGRNCIISAASYSGIYPKMLERHKETLKRTKFNGYHLSYIGAAPNPDGLGSKYFGVPYAFKFLALLEAEKLGFENLIWADSSLSFLKDPEPLFKEIEKNEALITFSCSAYGFEKIYLLDITRKSILECINTDCMEDNVWKTGGISAGLQGWRVSSKPYNKFKEFFLECLKDGRPFISASPDEIVMQIILSNDEFENIVFTSKDFGRKNKLISIDSMMPISEAKSQGYYFYLKSHPSPL
jgi:hypothetical protein